MFCPPEQEPKKEGKHTPAHWRGDEVGGAAGGAQVTAHFMESSSLLWTGTRSRPLKDAVLPRRVSLRPRGTDSALN